MHLLIGETRIPYEVVKTNNRFIRLTFSRDATVLRIETPKGKLDPAADAFLKQKEQWILRHFRKRKQDDSQRQHFFSQLENGKLLYQGKYLPLTYHPDRSRRIQKQGAQIRIHHLPGDLKGDRRALIYGALRSLARHFLNQRTLELAQATQSSPQAIRIKDHKTKWGSCSSKGNINLNWYLIFLPPHLIDYVIIHELMHLREMNHSPAYWAEVARYVPDYKEKRRQVKAFGWVIGMLAAEGNIE